MMFGGHEVYVGSKEIVWALPILSMHSFQRLPSPYEKAK
jgi:hypothetical protein